MPAARAASATPATASTVDLLWALMMTPALGISALRRLILARTDLASIRRPLIQMGVWCGSDGKPNAADTPLTGSDKLSDTRMPRKTPGAWPGVAGRSKNFLPILGRTVDPRIVVPGARSIDGGPLMGVPSPQEMGTDLRQPPRSPAMRSTSRSTRKAFPEQIFSRSSRE